MTIQIESSSLQARIIRMVREKYPVSMEQLIEELHLPRKRVELTVARLVSKGILAKDVLPDATFLRLARHDISFIGRRADQKRPIKHSSRGKAAREPEENLNVYR
ncbi:MAG: transcriptional regulator [Thermoplasmata archaeon]|nr:transcriptional regulator [Thermoplasmata archaeon]